MRIPGWGPAVNPAGLSDSVHLGIVAGVRPALFGLSELRRFGLGVTWSGRTVGSGLVAVSEGSPLFHVEGGMLAGAASVTESVAIGVGVCGEQMSFQRYGSVRYWALTVGLLVYAGDLLTIGTVVENPTRNWIVRGLERAPSRVRSDMSFQAAEHFLAVVGVGLEEHTPPTVGGGAAYSIVDGVKVRLGLTTDPDVFSAGIDVGMNGIVVGAAAWMHADLGWSEQIEIGFIMPAGGDSE